MTSVFLLTMLLFRFGSAAQSAETPHVHPVTVTNAISLTPAYLAELAAEMRTNHPALSAAGKRIESTQANVASVRAWEDPTFRLGGEIASQSMRADDGDLIYGVEQKLPVFGKEKQQRAVAAAGVAVSEQERDSTYQFLRRDLAQALFTTAYASRSVQVAREDIAWLKSLEETVEAQYRFGNALQSDVLRVQNALAKRRDELLTEEQMLHHSWFSLNRLLNRPLTNAWPQLSLPPIAGPVLYSERLASLAARHEPKLLVMRQQLLVADQDVALAKVRRRPDLGIGVQGRNYTGTGEFRSGEIMLSLSLPWFNRDRYRKDVIREESKKQALAQEIGDAELEVRHSVHDVTVRIDAARREALLYQDNIIPRTRQMLESLYANWQANTGPLRDVLETRRALLEAELARAKAIATQHQAMAELILCCGLGDFEALELLTREPRASVNEAMNPNVLPVSSRQSERTRNQAAYPN
jgi:outer membrane protein TolC